MQSILFFFRLKVLNSCYEKLLIFNSNTFIKELFDVEENSEAEFC
jgi:hypothetical protein